MTTKYQGVSTRSENPNDYFYVSTGAKNNFYTLRHCFIEAVYARTDRGNVETGSRERDYHLQNLSIDKAQALAEAQRLTGKVFSAEFDVLPIGAKHAVDWSLFQGGKYIGQSIHEVRETDPQYLIWIAENQRVGSPTYGKTVELIQSLMAKELGQRKAEKDAKAAQDAADRATRIAKYAVLVPDLVDQAASAWPHPSWQSLGKAADSFIEAWIVGYDRNGQELRVRRDVRDGTWLGDGFVWSVAAGLMNGELPHGRGLDIMLDIIASRAGRRNSKAYVQRMDEVRDILEA